MATLAASAVLHVTTSAISAESARPVAESSPSVGLAWAGPGPELACLGEAGLARAVNEYLGRDAFASGALDYVLGVSLERSPDRLWGAVLELRDASGHVLGSRELRSATDLCSDLDEPLVLAVALMVDSEPEPPPEPTAAPSEAQAEPEPEEPEASRQEVHSEPLELFADASVALEAGLLPAARPGLMLGVELRAVSWLSARLAATGFLPASVDAPGNASSRFAFVAGTLELCPGFGDRTSFRLSLCGGAVYGALFARSSGLSGSRSTWQRLLGGAFGPRASIPLGTRWFGVAGLTGVVPFRPDRFVYDSGGVRHELFRSSSPSVLASLGASVMF